MQSTPPPKFKSHAARTAYWFDCNQAILIRHPTQPSWYIADSLREIRWPCRLFLCDVMRATSQSACFDKDIAPLTRVLFHPTRQVLLGSLSSTCCKTTSQLSIDFMFDIHLKILPIVQRFVLKDSKRLHHIWWAPTWKWPPKNPTLKLPSITLYSYCNTLHCIASHNCHCTRRNGCWCSSA